MITLSTNSGTFVQLSPQGAELVSLNVAHNEYIWNGDPEFWPKHSPVLFPIVGTLKNDNYGYNGKIYSLPRHGFARDKLFTIEDKSANSAIFLLADDDDTFSQFPFRFELRLLYELQASSLTIGYEIMNVGDCSMPFSIGAHPAFAMPGDISDYSLKFESDFGLRYHLLENNLIAEKTELLKSENGIIPLSWKMFENDALIFKDSPSKSVMILKSGQPHIKVSYRNFPHLGLWTKPGAQFLCVEPWTGYSDSVEATGSMLEKESISLLNPGKTFKTNFRIDVF